MGGDIIERLRERNHGPDVVEAIDIIERFRAALRFYGGGQHVVGFSQWEGPSGDENWLCPPSLDDSDHERFLAHLDEHMVENGGVARAALLGITIDWEGEEPGPIAGEMPSGVRERVP